MGEQSRRDDPNIDKKLLFSLLLHVIIFKVLYLTKFEKSMIGGQVFFFSLKHV